MTKIKRVRCKHCGERFWSMADQLDHRYGQKMACPDHLTQLEDGTDVWHYGREEPPEPSIDISR